QEVQATPGPELIEAILAVFAEVTPVMNLCMYAPCLPEPQRVWDTRPLPDELSAPKRMPRDVAWPHRAPRSSHTPRQTRNKWPAARQWPWSQQERCSMSRVRDRE